MLLEEVETLANDVARMGGLAEHVTAAALDAAVRRDTALARSVIERDPRIDAMEAAVEAQVMRLLALRQPLAQDLRHALAALKIAGNLERIGDLSKNIAKRTLVLNEMEPLAAMRGVERMGKIVVAHLKEVLDAYSRGRSDLALFVWRRDDEVDEHYNALFREVLTYMMEDPRTIGAGAHVLFIAKNIERIGDHATNIAEAVHFLLTGETIERARPKGRVDLRVNEAGGG